MDFRSPHYQACAHATQHFWRQRVTSLILIPLSVWALITFDKALTTPHADMLAWLLHPANSLALVVWTLAVFYHAALGVQVVLEDYVSSLGLRRWSIFASQVVFSLLALTALSALIFIFIKQGNYGLCL